MPPKSNPFDDQEIRAGFLRIGYSETEIREMYQMFNEINKKKE